MKVKITVNQKQTKIPINEKYYLRSKKLNPVIIDLKVLADSVLVLENYLRKDMKINKVSIPLYTQEKQKIKETLETLFLFLFSRLIKFEIKENPQKIFMCQSYEISSDYSILFSGGLDSTCGIVQSKNFFKNVLGVFTIHEDQPFLIKFIRDLGKDILEPKGINIEIVESVKHGKHLMRTRGVTYILNTSITRRKKLIIPECGITMYQPHLTPLDEVTYTTHPVVLSLIKKMIEILFGAKICFVLPFENNTKAEIASFCGNEKIIQHTRSCRRIRFYNSTRPHCGVCYGCLIRRLSLLVADIEDACYRNDMITQPKLKRYHYANIMPLLDFCKKILESPEKVREYSRSIIGKYNKWNLFIRFAQDIYAGLMILERQNLLREKNLKRYLNSVYEIIGKETLENRISEIRERKFFPNFSHTM